jgi:hypothetical protein
LDGEIFGRVGSQTASGTSIRAGGCFRPVLFSVCPEEDSFCHFSHAEPGSKESSEACYKQINELHPEVCYVIHILPEKNSVEYLVLKEKSMQGLLVGQGILGTHW